MTRRREATAHVGAPPEVVFARLDDPTRLGEHMGKRSPMMGGGRMTYDVDALKGRAVGSHIRMGGSAFGFRLSLDEVITERTPPLRKTWRTVGAPKLVVIGPYEMGFEIDPIPGGSALKVWIDYDLPPSRLGHALPTLGDAYARWCVQQMAEDARRAFGGPAAKAGAATYRTGNSAT